MYQIFDFIYKKKLLKNFSKIIIKKKFYEYNKNK